MKLSQTLRWVAVLACAALAGLPASAGDKKDDKPALSGVWAQQGGELKIEFSDKDVMKISPHGDNKVIVVLCKYTVAKDGVVKAKVTELEGKEEAKQQVQQKVPVGLEFRFTWKVKDGTATLGDVKGDKVEVLKAHLEGKFDQKN